MLLISLSHCHNFYSLRMCILLPLSYGFPFCDQYHIVFSNFLRNEVTILSENMTWLVFFSLITRCSFFSLTLSSTSTASTSFPFDIYFSLLQFIFSLTRFPWNICHIEYPHLPLYLVFFSTWVFFHEHSQFTGQQGKGEAISLSPLYHFHHFTDT